MFAKKLAIVTYCFAILLNTSAYASTYSFPNHLVQIIPDGDYSSPSFTEPMGKAILVYPKRISPQKFQEITELYIMHPFAFDSFMQSLKTTTSHKDEEAMDLTPLVTMMIEKLDDTIIAAKDPSKDITLLPVLNKYLLHEVAKALKNKDTEYNTLFTNTQALSKKYNQYNLDLSMKRIDYAYQLGTKYSQYLDLDHIISLATVWLVGYILEQKGETPIVTSESVISIMPSIIEAEKLANGETTVLYRLLTQLDEKFGAAAEAKRQEELKQKAQADAAKASYENSQKFTQEEFNRALAEQKALTDKERSELMQQMKAMEGGYSRNLAAVNDALKKTQDRLEAQSVEFSNFKTEAQRKAEEQQRIYEARVAEEQRRKEDAVALRNQIKRRIAITESSGANLHMVNIETPTDQTNAARVFARAGGRYIPSRVQYDKKGRMIYNTRPTYR